LINLLRCDKTNMTLEINTGQKSQETASQTIAPRRTPRLSMSSATIVATEDRGESNAA
jgi:hypothetical protein